jgi:hypothetical protein
MRKQFELNEPNSCLNRAANNEMLFVLRSHDVCAPFAIREWCKERILRGKNQPDDSTIKEAMAAADIMERER